MSIITLLNTESNLGVKVDQDISAGATTAYLRFYDLETLEAREPHASNRTNLLVTLAKNTKKHDILILGNVGAASSGVSTCTTVKSVSFDNRTISTGATFGHRAETSGGCADSGLLFHQVYQILAGNVGTGANNFRVGDETAADVSIYAQNNHSVKPRMYWDDDKYSIPKFSRGDDQTQGDEPAGTLRLTAAEMITYLPDLLNGQAVYDVTNGVMNWVEGGAYVSNQAGGSVSNGSESTTGKVQFNTASQTTAATDTDGGDPTVNKPSETARVIQNQAYTYAVDDGYTSAFLTGDTGAQATFGTWAAVTNGSFRISVDGVTYNVDGINFTGDASMADVAGTIQSALRAATGGLETVVWSTNRFIISSVNLTSTSAITVTSTSTGTVGTDISGAGASDWMDCDTGNGVVTNKVKSASYYATLIPAPAAYTAGMEVSIKLGTTNTGACTLNINGLGVKNIKLLNGSDPTTGDLPSGAVAKFVYDGTNFQFQGFSSSLTAGSDIDTHFHGVASAEANDYEVLRMVDLTWVDNTGTSSAVSSNIFGGQTAASNNSIVKLFTSTYTTAHAKNPSFWVPVRYLATTAQDGFIGFVDANFLGTSIENNVMILDHFGFGVADGTVICTSGNGANQQTSAGIALNTSWNDYKATFNGATVTFYINGTQVATHATYVPNSNLDSFVICVIADATAAAKQVNIKAMGTVQWQEIV